MMIRGGIRVFVVAGALTLVSLTGCATQAPIAEQRPAQPVADSSDGQEVDMAEARERNKNQPLMTTAELRMVMEDPEHKPYLQLWRDVHSYYALLEITEGIIEPEIGRIRRQDIQELLGKGSPDYPNSNGHLLEYAGDRHVPYAQHLLIHFDDKDIVDRFDWVSE